MAELPIIIDIEASGFGRGSYPIEVGVALPNLEVHSFLIRPPLDWTHWSDSAEKIHGISKESLLQQGLSLKKVALSLNGLLRQQVAYSDAWGFDSSWLAKLYDQAGMLQSFKIESINKLLSEEQMEEWGRIKHLIWQERGITQRHRAAVDVSVIQETFRRIINQQ